MKTPAPRVVAELGRPETPEETAARKAESSRVYRSSQNTRSLLAALLATLVVVAIIIFAVPRGTPPPADPVDVAAAAGRVSDAEGRVTLTPEPPTEWVATRAVLDGDGSIAVWTVLFTPTDEEVPGYLRVAQGFDADTSWPARVFAGAAPQSSVTVGGIRWDRYDLDASRTGNITVALATTAGPDTILVYGSAADDALEQAAASLSDQIRTLRKETP